MKNLLLMQLHRPIPAIVWIAISVWGLACHVVTSVFLGPSDENSPSTRNDRHKQKLEKVLA